jgi:hypothetical protein
MSVVDLIATVHACGGKLWLSPDGKLHVSGRSRVPDELVDVARRRAGDLMAYLREHSEVATSDVVLAAIALVRGDARSVPAAQQTEGD